MGGRRKTGAKKHFLFHEQRHIIDKNRGEVFIYRTFTVGCKIEHVAREKKDLHFIIANGMTITRSVGFAVLRVKDCFTVDEVVFAEKGDLILLGARTLEGLSLIVAPRRKRLVASGPIPAA